MKTLHQLRTLFLFLTVCLSNAQVGIGTTSPQGALDIQATSNNYGLIIPRVALTATNIQAPVTNPASGTLLVGTMIFNTNSTSGINGVTPGIYFWDGSRWVSQFQRYFQTLFTQSSNLTLNHDGITGVYTNIPGLTNVSFIAPYTGKYQITFTNYLGCSIPSVDPTTDYTTIVATGEGLFKLDISSSTTYSGASAINKLCYSHSESTSTKASSAFSGIQSYYEMFNQNSVTVTINLTAGETCTLNGSFDTHGQVLLKDDAVYDHFSVGKVGFGSLGNSCTIEAIFLGRN